MHTTLALAVLALPAAALAQPAIYSNQSADPNNVPLSTGAMSLSGMAAPAGGLWSELQSDATGANAVGGLAAHPTSGSAHFRLADNFTVAGVPWQVHALTFYAYPPGNGVSLDPFASVNLRVWSGPPGQAGSTLVYGDTTTNRLSSANATNIYRIFNSTAAPAPAVPDATKRIWELSVATPGLVLSPGQYWLDWQVVPSSPSAEAFAPAVISPGQRTPAGADALQYSAAGWKPALDSGKPSVAADVNVEFPFIVRGYTGPGPCNADFDGDGDTGTDADIEAFFACLAGNCCAACGPGDFDGDGDTGTDADIEAFFRVLAGQPC
jgi:hypothetical protein